MGELSELKGIGPASEKHLNEIGIYTRQQLAATGAMNAFLQLRQQSGVKPSLNFLYALVGALEDEHWLNVAKSQKVKLLFQLEDYKELEKIFASESAE